MREIVTVMIAADSPVGRITAAIADVTTHLPSPGSAATCSMCWPTPWPCPEFDMAARHITSTGVRLSDLIPLDVHPHLWPPPTLPADTTSSSTREQDADPWFSTEKPHD